MAAAGQAFGLGPVCDRYNDQRGPYQVQMSRRAVRAAKRQRQNSAAPSPAVSEPNQLEPKRQKLRAITGHSTVSSLNLWAANKIVDKAVLCVDNVGLDCTENAIRTHLENQGI